jgi:DNA-binding IclR family transcriptional regulator
MLNIVKIQEKVKKNLAIQAQTHSTPYLSIQKAFSIIELLASHSPLGVTEIAQQLELEKSSVSRLLKNLRALGYAMQNADRGQYQLSPRILALAQRYLEGDRLVKEAKPILRDLAAAVHASAHLGILVEKDLIIVAKEPSPGRIQVTTRVGGRMTLHASALGKIILAGQPGDTYQSLLTHPLTRYTRHTITDMNKLGKVLEEIRQTGYALEVEEEDLGVGCIAAPVRDASGRWIAAISVAGPIQGTPFRLDVAHCQGVREKAEELSRCIGAT